ncbi:hypothetical protein VNI00_006814 [Paramarasmius palmivorus]|uniref:Cyclase n=1 Tax=Paramarasmius palmivorus TaxID=297713 RepID=A0AAW0D845_9AGAR
MGKHQDAIIEKCRYREHETFKSMFSAFVWVSILPALVIASPAQPLRTRQFNTSDIYANWPSYHQLPLDSSYPTKAAWGVWGADDELGALNHITPETIKAARAEIQHGVAVNLNLELNYPKQLFIPSRPTMTHAILAYPGYLDDYISLNTQVSTQYDGLRHYPYSTDGNVSTYQFYNDLVSFDDLITHRTNTLGIQGSAQKGVAGRAVLIDWAGWKESRGEEYDAFSAHTIPASDLDQVISWQGFDPSTFIHPGDFLIIRTGYMKQYAALTPHEQDVKPFGDIAVIGLETSEETLEWIWEHKVSLVGGDNPGFESFPNDVKIGGVKRDLHQVFLAGWGLSIVEFLDLERLAEECHAKNKFSFFFTLQNLNIAGGICGPPNVLAIL